MALREAAKSLGGLLLAGVLLWVVVRRTDPRAVLVHLEQVPLGGLVMGLALASGLNLGHNAFRVWRWRALLEPVRPGIAFRPMFEAVILGYTVTCVAPGRLGELVRPGLLAGKEGLPLGACLGSIFADRLLDGLAVLGLFAAGMLVTSLPGGATAAAVRDASLGAVALIAVGLGLLLAASLARQRLERWLALRGRAVVWVGRAWLSLARGAEALTRPKLLCRALLHTLAAWSMIALGTWVGLRSCGVQVPVGAVLVMLPLLVLGIALPTPGGAGGYHLAMKAGLVGLFAVSEPVAVAAGFLVHLAMVVPIVLLGGILLVVGRIPLGALVQAARQVRTLGGSMTADPGEKLP